MLLQAAVHVLVIHAPDSVFIAAQGRKLRFAAEIIQNMGKADVGRGVQQHEPLKRRSGPARPS